MLGFYNYTVILTYLGLCSGVTGIFLAFGGKTGGAVICLLLAGFFDMFDGKVAATKERTSAEKNFGIQLDSLSDLVCFGVLPAAIGYALGLTGVWYIPIACLYVLAALIRLAYFNVMEEERQKVTCERRRNYDGLPVTSVAALLPLLYCFQGLTAATFPYIYLGVLILCGCAFLITHIKVKKPSFKLLLVFLLAGAILLSFLILRLIFKF